MKTYTVTGYQAYGTRDPSAYFVDVSYRGNVVKRFDGTFAFENAMRYVSRNGGHAIINMGDRA
jgi:hypothetical protein